MKRTQFGSLADWSSFKGGGVFDVEDRGTRRITLEIVTEGASITWIGGNGEQLIASGEGHMIAEFGITGGGTLTVTSKATSLHSVRVDGRPTRQAGWTGAPSHVSLEPVEAGTVSPEVQKMFQTMQRNMMALRMELEAARQKPQG